VLCKHQSLRRPKRQSCVLRLGTARTNRATKPKNPRSARVLCCLECYLGFLGLGFLGFVAVGCARRKKSLLFFLQCLSVLLLAELLTTSKSKKSSVISPDSRTSRRALPSLSLPSRRVRLLPPPIFVSSSSLASHCNTLFRQRFR
jgi:hypothetical protein